MEVRNYAKNRKVGIHKGWYENGQKRYEYFIENDIPKKYTENGIQADSFIGSSITIIKDNLKARNKYGLRMDKSEQTMLSKMADDLDSRERKVVWTRVDN
jgi:hypothetical protein